MREKTVVLEGWIEGGAFFCCFNLDLVSVLERNTHLISRLFEKIDHDVSGSRCGYYMRSDN